jgi:hypothetical protein
MYVAVYVVVCLTPPAYFSAVKNLFLPGHARRFSRQQKQHKRSGEIYVSPAAMLAFCTCDDVKTNKIKP